MSYLGNLNGVMSNQANEIGIWKTPGTRTRGIFERMTREIGIRMALGAKRQDVVRLVLRQGLRLIGIGVALGLAGGAAAARLLHSLLYGLNPLDPVAYLGVSLILLLVAMLAIYLPARRATKVDPMIALRYSDDSRIAPANRGIRGIRGCSF